VTIANQQLDDRVQDLNTLLKLIAHLERPARSRSANKSIIVDANELAVMKASVFLVAYNLIESTVRTAFESIYARIETDQLSYSSLRSEIRELWIDQQVRGGIDAYSASPRNYHEKFISLMEFVNQGSTLALSGKHLPVSGNLDAKQIRKVCEKHGLPHNTPASLRGGQDLAIVRDQRNNLAHGKITFSECGRQYTVRDLKRIASQCERYVRYILRSTEKYAKSRLYLAEKNRTVSA
jgi:hypothetical protein